MIQLLVYGDLARRQSHAGLIVWGAMALIVVAAWIRGGGPVDLLWLVLIADLLGRHGAGPA